MKTIVRAVILLMMVATATAQPEGAVHQTPDAFPFQTKVDQIVAALKKEGSADRYVSLQGVCFCSRSRLLTEEERKAHIRVAVDIIEKVGIESVDKPDYRRKLQTAIFDGLKQAVPGGPVESVQISTVVIR